MRPDFEKYKDGLVPVIVQDIHTNKVLMLGYMNEYAYQSTREEKKVVFFSRAKQRLWMKGETSGNFLFVEEILTDCDNDCLLIRARPLGPVCHTGTGTCFAEQNEPDNFLLKLEQIIRERKNNPSENSYTSTLFRKGINSIAQKVGEEAVELVIEAKDENNARFKNEAADLMFHYLVLLRAKGVDLDEVVEVLKQRH